MSDSQAIGIELPARTALYRLYDGNDVLLYIGISDAPAARFRTHARQQPWWFQVHHYTLEWIDDRKAAEHAEKDAIRTETPMWNREHMPSTKIRQDYPTPPPRPKNEADEYRLARIAELKARMDADRAELLALIPAVFPQNRGEEPVRGRLNEVVNATGWTRAFVADIRDGKVKS